MQDYIDVALGDFTETGTSAAVYFVSTDEVPLDFADPQLHAQLDDALERLRANEWTVEESFSNWWESFQQYQDSTVEQVCQCLRPAHALPSAVSGNSACSRSHVLLYVCLPRGLS